MYYCTIDVRGVLTVVDGLLDLLHLPVVGRLPEDAQGGGAFCVQPDQHLLQ